MSLVFPISLYLPRRSSSILVSPLLSVSLSLLRVSLYPRLVSGFDALLAGAAFSVSLGLILVEVGKPSLGFAGTAYLTCHA